jgi:PAS domain-containing protein
VTPIVQFDPATLSIWYDLNTLVRSGQSSLVTDVVQHAVFDRTRELLDAVDAEPDQAVANRALHAASCVWHEKRHFVDFLLTNYGMWRWRTYLDLYANLSAVLGSFLDTKHLHLPILRYGDEVWRAIHGYPEPAPEIAALLDRLQRREESLNADRAVLQSPQFGSVELGGQSMFEYLAYSCQVARLTQFVGVESMVIAMAEAGDRRLVNAKYNAPAEVFQHWGILDEPSIQDGSAGLQPHVRFNATLANAIVYAALLSRHHRPVGQFTAITDARWPAERLAALLARFRGSGAEMTKLSTDECWRRVNEACAELFGRTAEDELRADQAELERHADLIAEKYEGVSIPIVAAVADLRRMRGELIELFLNAPSLFIAPEGFSGLVEMMAPLAVAASSWGLPGRPPPGWAELIAYEEPNVRLPNGEKLRFWWAAAPRMTEKGPIRVGPEHLDAWFLIASREAPIAKLLLSGLNQRAITGAEVELARSRLSAEPELGLEIEIDPAFEPPAEFLNVERHFRVLGADALPCDLTNESLSEHDAFLISPWLPRRSEEFARFLVRHLGGGPLAVLAILRDWSPWLVHRRFRPFLEARDYEGLNHAVNGRWGWKKAARRVRRGLARVRNQKAGAVEIRADIPTVRSLLGDWTEVPLVAAGQVLFRETSDVEGTFKRIFDVSTPRHVEAHLPAREPETQSWLFPRGTCVSLRSVESTDAGRCSAARLLVAYAETYRERLFPLAMKLDRPECWYFSAAGLDTSITLFVFPEEIDGSTRDEHSARAAAVLRLFKDAAHAERDLGQLVAIRH